MPPTDAVLAARPLINVAGEDNTTLSDGLLSLSVLENTQGLYRCEAVFGNWGAADRDIGFLYFKRDILEFGKPWQIKLGRGGDAETIFDGRIMGLEAQFPEGKAPQIVVLAEDRFQDLRMTRRTRTFEQVGDADVCNRIANDHGLSPAVDVSGPTYPVLAQVNQSDLAFLRERARTIDAELWMEGSTLHVQQHTRRGGETLELTYGAALREFTVLADLAQQRTSVIAGGWDVGGKDKLQYEATDTVLGSELNGDTSGARILAQALGTRKEALVHTVPLSSEETQAVAETYFKLSARRFLTGRGLADPDARLRVGSMVDLKGLGPLFSGKYYVVAVQHMFDGIHGLRTAFTVERPGLGQESG
jgi:phage protein D